MKLLVLLMSFFVGLTSCAIAEIQPSAALPTIPLSITTPEMKTYQFVVEVADALDSRRDGLMGRTELAPDRGMIFVFRQKHVLNFWMKNTLIPLDMVFIGDGGRVLKVHENARPHDLTVISSDFPVRWAMELAGGRAKELGITAGSVVTSPALQFSQSD